MIIIDIVKQFAGYLFGAPKGQGGGKEEEKDQITGGEWKGFEAVKEVDHQQQEQEKDNVFWGAVGFPGVGRGWEKQFCHGGNIKMGDKVGGLFDGVVAGFAVFEERCNFGEVALAGLEFFDERWGGGKEAKDQGGDNDDFFFLAFGQWVLFAS